MLITEEMLSNFKRGEMEEFYVSVYPSLIVYASRILGSDYAFLAEDCVQESIFKIYEQRGTFDDPSHFKSYLYLSVHNKAVTVLRKDKSMQNYLSQPKECQEDLQATIVQQETLDMLYAAIGRLPSHLREVFEMSFEQGLHNEEIASRLDISVSAVKKRKRKVIFMLRQSVGDEQLLLLFALFPAVAG